MSNYRELKRIGLGDFVSRLEGSQYTEAAKAAISLKPLQAISSALDQIVNRVTTIRTQPTYMSDQDLRKANEGDLTHARKMADILHLAASVADEMIRAAFSQDIPLPIVPFSAPPKAAPLPTQAAPPALKSGPVVSRQ